MRAETISAADGMKLAARVYEPDSPDRGSVVIGGAMGVRRALSITDDELMTLRGTHSLIDLYENAPSEVRRVAPGDLGVRRLGHFGPFRSEHEARLWPRMAEWIGALARPKAA